jgi:peptidyl-prolyl cis-trans isomerase A (cyclophilin A)
MHTNHGDIKINLFGDHAPITVANFEGLAEGTKEWTDPRTGAKRNDPLYNGVIFHRIIPGFMIQGGDPLGIGTGGPGYNFKDEPHAELTFKDPYKLAMANAGPYGYDGTDGTNGSQFFMVYRDSQLPPGYTVFGTIDATGLATLDKIAQGGVAGGSQDGKPATEVKVKSVLLD